MFLGNRVIISNLLLADASKRIPFANMILLFFAKLVEREDERLSSGVPISFCTQDSFYDPLGNTKPGSQLSRSGPFWGICLSNFVSFLIGQKCQMISFAAKGISNDVRTALPPHIFGVLGISPKPKVGWIYTVRAIAIGAIMKHTNALWDWSKMQHPTCSMGEQDVMATNATTTGKLSISLPCFSAVASPEPATGSDVDLSKEAIGEVVGKALRSEVVRSNFQHSVYSAVRVTGPAAFFIMRIRAQTATLFAA